MKRFFASVFFLCAVFSFVACGDGESPDLQNSASADSQWETVSDSVSAPEFSDTSGETDLQTSVSQSDAVSESVSDASSGSPSDSPDEPSVPEPEPPTENLVLAGDGYNLRVILYDLDLIQPGDYLEEAEIWSLDGMYGTGLKYREDTVFGDVVLLGETVSRIVAYPSKEVLWQTENSGNNTHSIEILPSGNIVLANSTGGNLRLFYSSAQLDGDEERAQEYEDYELYDAHGVLWDPEYEVLWAVGGEEIAAYRVLGEGTEQTLSKISGMGAAFPSNKRGGHDLSADLTDTRYLYVTVNGTVFRFDKETNTLNEKFPQYAKLSHSGIKGFGVNPAGNFFYCYPNGGPGTAWENLARASWSTDTLHFCYWKTENLLYVQQYKSEYASFYKCRVFYGKYQ